MCNSIRGDYLLFTLCGDTMFAHFVVPILQRGAHFNLKISNDNCSSVIKCKCAVTEYECPIDGIKSNSDRQLYMKTKKGVFIFFTFYYVNSISENYCAFTFRGAKFRIIAHRGVNRFFCFYILR